MRLPRATTYPLCLLAGALLVTLAATLHPRLEGDAGAQLGTIAHSPAWAAIHWSFLFGFPLALAGLAGIAGRHAGTPGGDAARAGLVVAVFGYGAWMIIVALMAGAGSALAQRHAGGDAGSAVLIYETLHPFALAAQRVAAFALGIATYLFGRAVLGGEVLARWLGWGGVGAGLLAIALALAFDASTRADEVAFAPPVAWQLAAAVAMLARRAD